jgi:hypothetical protein
MIWYLIWIAVNTAMLLATRRYYRQANATYAKAKETYEEASRYANQAREAYRRSNSYYDHATKLYNKIKEEMEQ